MLNIGILGCGRIGCVHALSIGCMDNARLMAVADRLPQAAKTLAERTGAKVMDPEAVIACENIDAVVIASPVDTHYDLIHAAARAGKAVFCEKPVDMSSDRIRECIAVIEETGATFMTAFNRRFDPNFATLQNRIRAGEIGQVELVTIISRDPNPPSIEYLRHAGSIFGDMTIHDFDMARFLLGEEPDQVFAVGSAIVQPDIDVVDHVDTAAVTLTTSSGAICQITNSRRAVYGYDQRVEVHGAAGMLRIGNVLENTVEVATGSGFCSAPTQHFFVERYEAAYRAEMAHFIRAVIDGVPATPTIVDGLRAQVMADAATESMATGTPVPIS